MEEEDQSEKDSYCPDFSDIYDESFQFWDFMNQRETLKKRPYSNETTFDDGDYKRPYITSDHSSLVKRDDDSHTFWDFLSSRTENTKHSPDSCQFSDIFNSSRDKLEEKLQNPYGYRETCDVSKVQQKYSASDEFWDFLNSSVEDDKYSAAEAPFISCGSSATEKQINAASCFETTVPDPYNHMILPRISSVCSLNTTSSVETLPETITPLSYFTNNSCEFTKATYQPVNYNNSMSDYRMVYYAAQSTGKGNLSSSGSQSHLKSNAKATHETVAHKNPVNDYKNKYYVVSNPANCISHSNLKNSSEVIHQTVAHKNTTSGYKMENYADTLNLQNPIKNSFLLLRESPNSTSCSTPGPLNFETQNLKKAENISHSESMCQNNTGTEPLYVLIPNSETLQKPNYSQYFIIVNNAQPQKTINKDEAANNIEQKTTAQNFSSTQNYQTIADDSFQNDIQLAGFRNNHILNVCKQKRSFEWIADAPNSSESSCSIPVSSAPLDIETLNSISSRIKCKQNNFSEAVKKQNIRQKPIKCIPLRRCKNAIQQIDTPIRMEAFEANAKNNLPEPCSTPALSQSNFDRESMSEADTTPLCQSNDFSSQSNSILSITFTQIPFWNEKYLIKAPTKQNIAPPSCQVTKVHDMPLLSSRGALPNSAKGLIFQETRQNKIILPKPPPTIVSSRDNNRVVPKLKKCRRKTVKELLLERQQNFRHQSEMASLAKLRESEKYYVSEASPTYKVGNDRPVYTETNCCDDPKNSETSLLHEGETTDQWPPEKSLRPRYYDMSELQIGFFKVQEDADVCGRFRSKFKVLFMKRQFLYDFPVSRCNQPSLKTLQQELDDDMARIVVPFKAITSIYLKDRMIYLNVDYTPQLSLMNTQSQFADNNTIWSHFLESSYTHKVVLRKRQASKLKWILCQFDERFITLTDITLGENQFDSPVSFKKRFNKNRKFAVRRPPEQENKDLLFNQVCSCRTSCRSIRCSCVKAAQSCSSTCQCTNCNNPLNVLEAIGLDIHYSLKDSCLFQNIYQIPDLSNYLAREVRLDCCNCLARIQDCIPGTVLCPNINCNASLQYSWCQKFVSYQDRNPRNHCSLCGQCRFSSGRHCHMCKKCYAVTSKSNKCPTCLNETLQQIPRRSLNTFCYDKKTSSLRSYEPQIVVLNSSSTNTSTKSQEESFLCDLNHNEAKNKMNFS